MSKISLIDSVSSLFSDYEYFILDIWGVIHDGRELYPGVIETLSALKNSGKKVCFLSNAPRRSRKVADQLRELGIRDEFYEFVITSGEAAHLFLHDNQNLGYSRFGSKFFYIGPSRDFGLLDDLEYHPVEKINDADFFLVTGFENEDSTIDEMLPLIVEAKKRNLEMVCVNPDLRVVRKSGEEAICAGALAAYYEKIGGKVCYFGKPYEAVFEAVFKKFSIASKTNVVVIGDGIETDILGAERFGLDCVLVLGGIYSKNLTKYNSSSYDFSSLESILKLYKTCPKFVISNFKI